MSCVGRYYSGSRTDVAKKIVDLARRGSVSIFVRRKERRPSDAAKRAEGYAMATRFDLVLDRRKLCLCRDVGAKSSPKLGVSGTLVARYLYNVVVYGDRTFAAPQFGRTSIL